MGAWSHEPFGNDTACDWAYGLDEQRDFSLADKAIQAVLDNGNDYLDSDLASEAIAAAEVLARAWQPNLLNCSALQAHSASRR